jgi:hypothetical protein
MRTHIRKNKKLNGIAVACFGPDGHHLSYLKQIIDYAHSQDISIIVIGSTCSLNAFRLFSPRSAAKVTTYHEFAVSKKILTQDTSSLLGRLRVSRYESTSLNKAAMSFTTASNRVPLLLIGGDIYMPVLPLLLAGSLDVHLILIRPPLILRNHGIYRLMISWLKLMIYTAVIKIDPRIKRVYCLDSTRVDSSMLGILADKLRLIPDPVFIEPHSLEPVSADLERCVQDIKSMNKKVIFLFYGSIDPRKNIDSVLDEIRAHPRISEFAFIIAGKPSNAYIEAMAPIITGLKLKKAYIKVFARYISLADEDFLFSNCTNILCFNEDSHISSGVIHKALVYGLIVHTSREIALTNRVESHDRVRVCRLSGLAAEDLVVKPTKNSFDPTELASKTIEKFANTIIANMVGTETS